MFIIRPVFVIAIVIALCATTVSAKSGSDRRRAVVWSESIQIVRELRSDVEEMLQRSPTFQAQYRRIADTPMIVVGVHVDGTLCGSSFRARTTFRRYASGLIAVAVAIGPGRHQGEWIAHEFEHILEQLDGRDLMHLAQDGSRDVWFSGTNVIETGRAIRAGHSVRDELLQSRISR